MTGVALQVPCGSEEATGLSVAAIDVPAFGDCLYHAGWQSASRNGLNRPFGIGPTESVYEFRVNVAERAVHLLAEGKLSSEEDPIMTIGDLIAQPRQYLRYSGQLPQMTMSHLIQRTIVTLCADGVVSVCPHDFASFIGGEDVWDPVVVYHCNAGDICQRVPLSQRNHYVAVVLDAANMQLLRQMVRRHRIAGSSREPLAIDDNEERLGGDVGGEPNGTSGRPIASQPRDAGGASRSSGSGSADEKINAEAESKRLRELSDDATRLVDLSIDDVRLLSMNYTTCPRLALLYYHCCSNDPRAHVFNNERLLGEGASHTVERLQSALDSPVGLSQAQTAKALAGDRIGLTKDIHACASCCEILHDYETGVEKKPLLELVGGFRLTEEEVRSLAGIPESVRKSHVQVLECGGLYYHLNPDLVPDVNQVVLCRECCRDPRSVRFSIASGHDYGRPGSLPVLNDVAGNCIAPVRRFGTELLLSGKHTSGHFTCFPSDGPVQCAKVLPWTDVDVLPRVTFVGATGTWQSKKAAYRRLYELPCDDIYSWLKVLQYIHGAFREHGVVVSDIEKARHELGELEQFIESGVICSDSAHFNAVDEVTRSERYGDDAETDADGGELLVTRGAVLKNVAPASGTEGSSLAVEMLLGLIDEKSESTAPPVVPVTRGEDPVVEWSRNGNTIASAFPRLFMRGGASLPDGSWGKPLIQHLMRYYDGRFEQDTRFVAMLFNQMQRHAAVRRAAKLGSSHTRVLERFGALVNSGDFRDRLVVAKENPERPESRRLNSSLLRVLSLVGGCVPFSPFERAAARPKIAALRYRYGVPQHWVTIAPPEHDNMVLHRIALIRERHEWNVEGSVYASGQCTHDDLPEHLRSSARARLVVANQFPALAVQVFERCVRAVFDDIVMSSSSLDTRRSRSFVERGSGAYGKIAAHCAVVEAQVDGRLHVHSLLYGSAYTPELLTRVACCPELCQQAASWLESVCTTKLRAATHSWRSKPRAHGERPPRAYEVELSAATEQSFFSAAEKRAATTNFHSHSHTCYKGTRGKYMCRLARPAGTFLGPTQPILVTRIAGGDPSKGTRPQLSGQPLDVATCASIDAGYDISQRELFGAPLAGPVLWELERPEADAMFVETNLVLAGLTASHTNSSMVNGEDSGDMVEQYQQAYMTKDEPGLRNAIPVLITAVDHTLAYPSKADDAATDTRKGKYLAARTVNAFSGAHEWSHTTMVYALCGHRSFVSSDTFWYLFPYELVKAVRGLRGVDGAHGVDQDVDCPSKDVDVELETLVAMANNDSHATTAGSPCDTGAGARSFRVGDRVVFVTQAESYRHRGDHFEPFSPLEFECIVDTVTVNDEEDQPPHLRGRPRRTRFPFASTHPLVGQYVGIIRAKMHTPILGGHSPPAWVSGVDDKAAKGRNATAEYVMALFTPWGASGPSYPSDEDGLLRLCRDWDHSKAPFVNRQRIRSVRNLLKRGHRSWKNEQLITEWRNRNVDLWGTLQKRSGGGVGDIDADRECDEEMLGVLPTTMDMYQVTLAVASRQTKVPSQLRRVQGMVVSIMDDETPTTHLPRGSRGSGLYYPRPGSEPLKRLAARLRSLTKLPVSVSATVGVGVGINDPLAGTTGPSVDLAGLSPEQASVVTRVLDGVLCGKQTLTLLHGGGGTGKSHVIRRITEELGVRGREVVNTCTTGAGAVQLVNGRTFHSAFKCYRSGRATAKAYAEMKLLFSSNVGLVVVDEVSMLGADLLTLMDERLRDLYDSKVPFGGVSVLLVGDFWQLEVIGSAALCGLLYSECAGNKVKAKSLFSQFKVVFLTHQQRATGCLTQQRGLDQFRSLPAVYPDPATWSFSPITEGLADWLTRPLTQDDVAADPCWLERSVILVTGNTDRAALNTTMARLLSSRTGRLLFRWQKPLSSRSQSCIGPTESLLYSEDERPYLFGYFYTGARGQILDNGNGNVEYGVANGSPCTYHSMAWDDPTKTAQVATLIARAEELNEPVVQLPFPPDFINVSLCDRDNKPLSNTAWPATENLCGGDLTNGGVVIPIGIVGPGNDRFKVSLRVSSTRIKLHYEQHAVDLAMAMTVWKAQGSTFDRVILHLEGSNGSPSWKFEHLYVAASRVRAAEHLRCLPLSRPQTRARLLTKGPEVSTVRWRMDVGDDGVWTSRCLQRDTDSHKRCLESLPASPQRKKRTTKSSKRK